MRAYPVFALTLIAWLVPLDSAHAGACDDLNAKVCAGADDAAACDGFVADQLRGSNGERLSGMPRLEACRMVLDDRSTLGDLQKRAKSIGDPQAAIVGVWRIDLERTMAADPKMTEMPEDAKRQAMEQARAFLGDMSFEFTADGTAVARMGSNEKRSVYAIKRRVGDTLTVEMTEGQGGRTKTETMTFIVDGDRLMMKQGTQRLVLRRK